MPPTDSTPGEYDMMLARKASLELAVKLAVEGGETDMGKVVIAAGGFADFILSNTRPSNVE